jgi:carbonic anhydrase
VQSIMVFSGHGMKEKHMSEPDLSATQSTKFGSRLSQINTRDDMPTNWHNTPIEDFIAAHNFDVPIKAGSLPKLLIVSCIEFRFLPQIPRNFAYVIRSAGGRMSNIPGSEFALSYILANGVRYIVTVGHNDCGMTKVHAFKPRLVAALVDQGWEEGHAHDFIEEHADRYAMDDEIDSLEFEFIRLRSLFKKVEIAPLFVSLSSTRLHLPRWYSTFSSDPRLAGNLAKPSSS